MRVRRSLRPLAKVLEGEPDWEALPGAVPSIIRFVLSRCFEKDPNRRLQHMDGARILIEEALTGSTEVSPGGLTGAVQSPLWRRAVPWISAVLIAVVTGIAVWSVMRWAPPPVTKLVITPPQSAPLRNGGGIDVAISPDGRKIVYIGGTESSGQLYVRSLDELTPAPIAGTEGAVSAFFSPDGESVAFSTSDELKKVSLLGGPSATVSDLAGFGGGSWGSEETIVFSQGGEGGTAGLYRVSTSGGEEETLAVPDVDQGELGYRSPENPARRQGCAFHDLRWRWLEKCGAVARDGREKDCGPGGQAGPLREYRAPGLRSSSVGSLDGRAL